jgi:hypothetical protein
MFLVIYEMTVKHLTYPPMLRGVYLQEIVLALTFGNCGDLGPLLMLLPQPLHEPGGDCLIFVAVYDVILARVSFLFYFLFFLKCKKTERRKQGTNRAEGNEDHLRAMRGKRKNVHSREAFQMFSKSN